MKSFFTVNPTTGLNLQEEFYQSADQIEKSLAGAFANYQENRIFKISDRSAVLLTLGQALRAQAQGLAQSMTLEMGKCLTDSLLEVEKCAGACDYFAAELPRLMSEEQVPCHAKGTKILKEPLGPILCIMPWNYPLWQVMRFAIPAVAIGNPVLLKHAEITTGTARLLAKVFDSVKLGLMHLLIIDHEQTAKVLRDSRVRGVTLTGSSRAGREIGKIAGESLKKSVLELGGSDAYLVLQDADLELAVKVCVRARMTNNGQSCIGGKRFVVHKSLFSDFTHLFQAEVKNWPWGDPFSSSAQVGPLAHKKFQQGLAKQCEALVSEGAQCLFDFSKEQSFDWAAPSAFFPPRAYTVKSNIKLSMEQELFGPVALCFSFDTVNEAVNIANQSVFGLGGAVFSRDLQRAEAVAKQMECGFPFGGVKDSGYGRELGAVGFSEFCNIKSVTSAAA